MTIKVKSIKLIHVNPLHIEWVKVNIYGRKNHELKVFNGVEGSHTYKMIIESQDNINSESLTDYVVNHFSNINNCPKPFRYACSELRIKDIESGVKTVHVKNNKKYYNVQVELIVYHCKEKETK